MWLYMLFFVVDIEGKTLADYQIFTSKEACEKRIVAETKESIVPESFQLMYSSRPVLVARCIKLS